jgi:outer membrane protein assembly factor BamB
MRGKTLVKNTLVFGIILLFIVSAVGPMVIGYESDAVIDIEITERTEPESTIASNQMDSSWPMYQHDVANTGFSSSPFPDSLNLSYNLTYSEIINSTFLSPYSSPIVANGKIFIAGRGAESDIFALHENNGSLIWKKNFHLNETSTVFVFPNSPAVSNGKVFICFGSLFSFPPQSKIFALDENTGEIIWESSIFTNSVYTSVTVSNNKVIVGGHFTSFLPISRLCVFDADNGDLIWSKTMIGYYESTPVVSDTTVFAVTSCKSPMTIRMITPLISSRARIYAFDLNDGSKKWYTRIQGHVIISSPVISSEGLLIPSNIIKGLSKWDRMVTVLDVNSGNEIWHYQIKENASDSAWPTSISTPSVAYGKIFINDVKGLIIALDAESGDMIWEREIIEDITPSISGTIPPVIADHKVITSYYDVNDLSNKNWICMFNVSDGEKIWSIEFDALDGDITQLTVANGKLFVNTRTGLYVYS